MPQMISALWFAAREAYLAGQSRNWPEMPGILKSARQTTNGPRDMVKAEIEYSYPENQNTYLGKTVRVFASIYNAERMLEMHGIGDKVRVRVNPLNPAKSYLPSGIEYGGSIVIGLAGVLIGVFVILVSVTFLVLGLKGAH
jgi:hypothetical protein